MRVDDFAGDIGPRRYARTVKGYHVSITSSPRHRMPCYSANEGSKCVSMTWQVSSVRCYQNSLSGGALRVERGALRLFPQLYLLAQLGGVQCCAQRRQHLSVAAQDESESTS